MANKKTNSAKRGNTQSETNPIVMDIILWGILAFSILLFISNMGLGGLVGGAVSSVMFGLFGVSAYAVPILICVASFFLISNKNNRIAYIKVGCGFLLLILLDLLIELFRNGNAPIGPVLAYTDGAKDHVGGGFFGGLLALILAGGFGLVGAYIIDIVLIIVSTILITEKALLLKLKELSDQRKVREKKERPEPVKRKREPVAAIEDKSEKQPLRMEKKASSKGLNLDLLTINGISSESDEVTQIDEEAYAKAAKEKEITRPEVERVSLNSSEPTETMFKVNMPSYGNDREEAHVSDDMKDISSFAPDVTVGDVKDAIEDKSDAGLENAFAHEAVSEPVYEEVSPEEDEIISDEMSAFGAEMPYEAHEPVPQPVNNDMSQGTAAAAAPSSAQSAPAKPVEAPRPKPKPKKPYRLPTVDLLRPLKGGGSADSAESVQETAMQLQNTLASFGVNVRITEASVGPAVTRYELAPEQGVKVSRIVSLADDIKLNLAAADIRIEAPIPGKAAVGIEVPNKSVVMVPFREMMDSSDFKSNKSLISFAAGKDIGGKIVISDIAKMPHVLIAGATGSGKSVCINTIIMSILYHASPDDVKFIMIDPKVVELSVYNGIPHLLVPVVTDPKKAAAALNWAVKEMTDRYNKFASAGVRDMKGYNAKIKNGTIELGGEKVAASKMPQIVVVVDELADLMMVASGEVEEAICRLAQLARAAGIHLIIATQRPSVNVITGLIKANMPSRIAFAVTSGVDSRTILDMNGAEKLLGKGDMLYYPQGAPKPMRVQGAFVSDEEVESVCNFIRDQEYGNEDTSEIEQAMEAASQESSQGTAISGDEGIDDGRDAYFAEAGRFIIDKEKASIGLLQRNFKIGFNRAARIMDQLAEAGVVGPEEGTKPRKILVNAEEFEAIVNA